MARGVARGGFQGFRNPPLLFITVILSQQEFYAYSKYSEHHCVSICLSLAFSET